jgi:hypothetical protein
LLSLLALLSGCKKKKPPVPAPQEQAPSITAAPAQPAPQPQPQPQPEAQPQPSPSTSSTPVTPPAKPKPRPKSTAKKPAPPAASTPKPEEKKTPAPPANKPADTTNTQLAADLPAGAARQQRQTAAQLRATAETNLRSLARALSNDEKSMIQQIQYYLQQSRAAENDGDTERSYNLALKAQLLSNELVRR